MRRARSAKRPRRAPRNYTYEEGETLRLIRELEIETAALDGITIEEYDRLAEQYVMNITIAPDTDDDIGMSYKHTHA